jgi:hypothetical protein
VVGGFAEVDEREVKLAVSSCTRVPRPTICLNSVMLPTSRSSTIRRQVCASTPVDSRREVVTMTGTLRFGVDEVAELLLALGVVAGDAHDVARVLLHQVGVFIDEAWRMRAAWACPRRRRWSSGNGRRWP